MYVEESCRKFGEREGQNRKNRRARRGLFRDLRISETSKLVREREREVK